MTAVSDRVAFKDLCRSTLAAHFANVTDMEAIDVHYGAPGEAVTDELVILGKITGNAAAEVFGPAGNADEFTVAAEILTHGHDTEYEADQRAQAILNEVNAALFQSRFASSLNARAFPGRQDGPNGDPPLDGQPAASIVEFDIAARISVRGS